MTLTLITGGHSGLGRETVRQLEALGHEVEAPARPQLDLADLHSIHAFAAAFLASGRRIDVLVCNAGIMAPPEQRVGDGWESQFAVNHLGHYVLVNLLRPALTKGARVIVLASGLSAINWDDPQFEQGYDKWAAYLQSKTANRLFALELDRRGAAHGVRSFSVAPGYILTPLTAVQDEETNQFMISHTPMGRPGNPIEVANAVLFLASDDASYITGVELDIDGGFLAQ